MSSVLRRAEKTHAIPPRPIYLISVYLLSSSFFWEIGILYSLLMYRIWIKNRIFCILGVIFDRSKTVFGRTQFFSPIVFFCFVTIPSSCILSLCFSNLKIINTTTPATSGTTSSNVGNFGRLSISEFSGETGVEEGDVRFTSERVAVSPGISSLLSWVLALGPVS